MRTKAVFFPIGLHTTYHPDILRQVAAAGRTIGPPTWSHAHLASKKMTEQQAKDEIEKGFSAVKLALGAKSRPVLPLPGAGAYASDARPMESRQHREVLGRRRLQRLQVEELGCWKSSRT